MPDNKKHQQHPAGHLPAKPRYVTVEEFCHLIEIGKTTFYRYLKQQGLPKPGGNLSPVKQNWYCEKLGLQKIWPQVS